MTGAIWSCARENPQNIDKLLELKAIEGLVALLRDQPENVLINVAGAIGDLAITPKSQKAIKGSGGVDPLVELLTRSNQTLLTQVRIGR